MLTVASLGSSAAATGAAQAATGAESAVNALNLGKSLASASQVSEAGTVMAGAGAKDAFRKAGEFAARYGGEAADWVKMSSSKYVARDGLAFETHWVQNLRTGFQTGFKTVLVK